LLEPENAFNQQLGANIRRLRGKTPQASIAEAAGISRTSLVLIEQGKQRVHAYLLTRLATALGSPTESLLPTNAPAMSSAAMPDVHAPRRVRDWVEEIVNADVPGGGSAKSK
jgi:transcriptional regulator with XRE-family HTH domain